MLQEQEAELNEMKSQFFTNVSHDFRTPLTLIAAPVDSLLYKYDDPDTVKDLRLIKNSAERLKTLIDELLEIDRLEKGNLPLRTRELNIVDVVLNTTLYMEKIAARKKQTLSCISSTQEIQLFIDRPKIERVLINLISNACKYTPIGGKITVSIDRKPAGALPESNLKYIDIAVSDDGPGMAQQEAERIFDRFYQGSSNKDQTEIGSGIGLSLAKNLAELHHGKIALATEEGQGSTFTISLPVGKAHLKEEEILPDLDPATEIPEIVIEEPLEPALSTRNNGQIMPKPALPELPNPEQPLVLIVEDFEDLRVFMRDSFSASFRVDVASDGLEGLNKARERIPDLIISDVMMPKMSGLEMCRALKQDQKTRHVPLILLTAKTTENERIEGLSVGADAYVPKPFNWQALKSQANNLVETRRAMIEQIRKDHQLFPLDQDLSSQDKQFFDKVVGIIIGNISNGNFQNTDLAKAVGYTRQNLSLKIKKLTGMPTNELISQIRLQRAAEMLKQNTGNVSEIALEVGYKLAGLFCQTVSRTLRKIPQRIHEKRLIYRPAPVLIPIVRALFPFLHKHFIFPN